ncbi:MAG: hypothetical protein KAV42_05335, partial [Candidatus Krumholzibacteria bacterium]|nr:hypothetical protein [Candidatus Krumholzibacteria bacterium]
MRSARVLPVIFLICTYLTIATVPAGAEWLYGGTPVSTESYDQEGACITEDGEGGSIVVWEDGRLSGHQMIYAQRFDSRGNALWTEGGVSVCNASGYKYYPRAVPGGDGGAVIVWQDGRSGNYDIYMQKLDGDGIQQWLASGFALCTAPDDQREPRLVPDGTGGAIVAWEDERNVTGIDIYARRVDGAGTLYWTVWGEAISTESSNQWKIDIITDMAGGAIIVWSDERDMGTSLRDIYYAHIEDDGNITTISGGTPVCTADGYQNWPEIVRIDDFHFAICWYDGRNLTKDLYVQYYYLSNPQLTENGAEICSIDGALLFSNEMTVDDQGRLVVCWYDSRSGPYRIYAQCYDLQLGPVWTDDGVAVCGDWDGQEVPKIVPDGAGGSIISWVDYRLSDYQARIYAQRLDSDGARLWNTDGIKICSERNRHDRMEMISDGNGGAYMVWEDLSLDGEDIYAQRIDRKGYIASPEPSINAANDVPGDEGGQIDLSWYASYLDPVPNQEIPHYTIWKSLTPAAVALMKAGGARMSDGFADIFVDPDKPVIRIETLASATWFWELIDSQTAQYYESYSKVVATNFDSSDATSAWHYFQVAAHTADPLVVFTSAPDSARSVDNLAPATPMGVIGEQEYTPEGLQLTWDANTEPDLGGYLIFRGAYPTFVPGSASFIATIDEIEYFDDAWDWESGYWYKIAAFDVHENVSGYAVFGPGELTGEDLPDVPASTYIAQNYPNPFNPTT